MKAAHIFLRSGTRAPSFGGGGASQSPPQALRSLIAVEPRRISAYMSEPQKLAPLRAFIQRVRCLPSMPFVPFQLPQNTYVMVPEPENSRDDILREPFFQVGKSALPTFMMNSCLNVISCKLGGDGSTLR